MRAAKCVCGVELVGRVAREGHTELYLGEELNAGGSELCG